MERSQVVDSILRGKVIAIVRLAAAEEVRRVVEAIHAGGIECVEVSLTTPGALRAIAEIRDRVPDVLIGAGTVCESADLDDAVAAGARFVVTPITVPGLVPQAHAKDVPILMGGLTPTELHAAHTAGADFVKLFPASTVDPGYLRAVRAPLPALRVVPTGGVDAGNAAAWLAQGAAALGVGGSLTDPGAIAAGRFEELTAAAAALIRAAHGDSPDSASTQSNHS